MKVEFIIQTIIENFNGIFVYSDVDVIFFRKVSNDLLSRIKNVDMVFQSDNNKKSEINTGFFVCRANTRTLELWLECKKRLETAFVLNTKVHDQHFINQIISDKSLPLNYKHLPIDKYSFTEFGEFENGFNDNKIYALAKSAYTCHVIYTYKIKDKELFLSRIENIVSNRQNALVCKHYYKLCRMSAHRVFGRIGLIFKRYIPRLYQILKPYFPDKK
jgi:hypothetical protein